MSASRFALKEAKSKGMFEGVAKPYCRESRRASAMEAKFQVIFLGTQLHECQKTRFRVPSWR
jgi:phosphopantetheinyl transferase (holo-ACP synthase)